MEFRKLVILLLACFLAFSACKQESQTQMQEVFNTPAESTKPWVFWYWIKAAVSKEGITADLEAMAENGIGGAYLIPIQNVEEPPLFEPPVETLTPEWWEMLDYAFKEAKRLGLKIAMHSCDGFAVAGGPWITPEKSMQKVVWSTKMVTGDTTINDTLPQPETVEDYYKDIAVFAYPTQKDVEFNTDSIRPKVTSNITKEDLSFLADPENTKQFKTYDEGYIEYAFDKPFTCRSIHINTKGFTYAAHRLIIKASTDGVNFDSICRLKPPRHGWQDYEEDVTYSIPTTTATKFRFYYTTEGFEPGSEDMDLARWSPRLKIQGIKLMGNATIHEYEAKNGVIWRIGERTSADLIPKSLCVRQKDIINISNNVDSAGHIIWDAPEGNWTILRMGHTSTGHTNYIGGRGLGLECDKFDPDVAAFQFDQWFGKVFDEVDEDLAEEILKVFHIDSWECGSQNWSKVFRAEFMDRRGYDIYSYLPIYAGLPIDDVEVSEKVLHDIRKTIDELITDNFFGTMAEKAKKKDCEFSSESVAPVMISDAMAHFKQVDIPMGEFWFNSPTHDKPNDVLDAISAAWVYNKQIVQSEAFTTLRMDWNEHPGMLKTLLDRNFALGVNKLVFHVFTENPWTDKEPGMTMNTIGLYFQRDQIWWKQSKDWIDYIRRCQSLLQQGKPVVDVAVFTGEEYPRRSLTPDRLINILPGLFGEEAVEKEKERLLNIGAPQIERPYSVKSSANTFDPANWTDPLRGYKYTSINKDALLNLTRVKDGTFTIRGGQSFKVLVIPGIRKGSPNGILSKEVCEEVLSFVRSGAYVIIEPMDITEGGLKDSDNSDAARLLFNHDYKQLKSGLKYVQIGRGFLIQAPYQQETLNALNIHRDLVALEDSTMVNDIAWIHKSLPEANIYFVSNQANKERILDLSFRINGKVPEIFDPETGEIADAGTYSIENDRTSLPIKFAPNQSFFIVFEKDTEKSDVDGHANWPVLSTEVEINTPWMVSFDPEKGGPQKPYKMNTLVDWTKVRINSIKYYSGTAVYKNTFDLNKIEGTPYWLEIPEVSHIAQVFINGKDCDISWTPPYRFNISDAVEPGKNTIEIEVTTTWKNRIIGDNTVFASHPLTYTTAPFRIEGQPLVSSGIKGPVTILKE